MASGDHSVLFIDKLAVQARDRRGKTIPIVEEISFSINSGKVTALIGESGSGKTTIALACLGYARPGCEIVSGEVRLSSTDILSLSNADCRKLRGRDIAYIAQSAVAAFNSAWTIDRQVIESALLHKLMNRKAALDKARRLYRELDLPEPGSIGKRYPHQVSGGQLQRLMAAMAMMCDPQLLILDEPTTALDVTTQIEVLLSFKKLIQNNQTSAIYVSHDLAVVAQIADDILVLKDGRIVESGPVESIIENPQHPYTRELIGAAHVMPEQLPEARSMPTVDAGGNVAVDVAVGVGEQPYTPLLTIASVTAGYGRQHRYLALHDINLEVHSGRTLGVIGESGSGKTTLARVVSGLMQLKSGQVDLAGQRLDDSVERRDRDTLRHIQFAFQMADVALNPCHKVSKIIGRPLQFYFDMDEESMNHRTAELLELVELPAGYANRFPRQLSGGERQRVNLARALAADPQLIICDEITSALDTVVAKAILELLKNLQAQLNVSYLFISHDLSVIANIADTIAVMRDGEVVEFGLTRDVMTPPLHPYTRLLLDSVPEMRTDWLESSIGLANVEGK